MLRVVCMSCHFFNSTFICTTKHYHTHAISSSLTNDCGVCIVVKSVLELLIDLFILCCHGHETKTQADTVLDCLILSTVAVTIKEEIRSLLCELICMDKTICIICTSS